MLKRHAIQVLRRAGHTLDEIATFVGVSKRSVQRVVVEPAVVHDDTDRERVRRQVGRPSKAEPFRARIAEWLGAEPELLSVEILRRARLAGYAGAKSALYELVREVRPAASRLLMRFEESTQRLPPIERDGARTRIPPAFRLLGSLRRSYLIRSLASGLLPAGAKLDGSAAANAVSRRIGLPPRIPQQHAANG